MLSTFCFRSLILRTRDTWFTCKQKITRENSADFLLQFFDENINFLPLFSLNTSFTWNKILEWMNCERQTNRVEAFRNSSVPLEKHRICWVVRFSNLTRIKCCHLKFEMLMIAMRYFDFKFNIGYFDSFNFERKFYEKIFVH